MILEASRQTKGVIVTLYIVCRCISGQNLALGKDCFQSSLYDEEGIYNYKAFLATDGTISQDLYYCNYTCCSATDYEAGSWWVVDLEDVYEISNVVIFGRTDCCQDRLSKFYIEAINPYDQQHCSVFSLGNQSNFDKGQVSECHYQESATTYLNVSCKHGTMGQFLRIRLTEHTSLVLCEVEVYGHNAGPLYLGKENTLTKCGVIGSYYQGNLLLKSQSRSVIECVTMCSFRDGCFAVNFKAIGNECDLMEKLPGGYSLYLLIDSDWIAYFNP